MSKTMEQIYSSTCSSQSSNLFVEEVVINDASSSARDFLTQRSTQKEISELSGASISTRGVYKPPGEENTNSTTKPLYLHIEGLSKSDVRIAAGRIIHLKKECSHIKEETPPTQHQGSSVASTSTVPQVPDEKVRRTAEIRRKDSGKPTSLMTVDPPFKSSPQQLSGASISSTRGIYKTPRERDTNSTTKPPYLYPGVNKADERLAAGRINHLMKERSHIKEETPPTQHQDTSVASTSTVPQVPDVERFTTEIRPKVSGKSTSPMTMDPPFKSSPQQLFGPAVSARGIYKSPRERDTNSTTKPFYPRTGGYKADERDQRIHMKKMLCRSTIRKRKREKIERITKVRREDSEGAYSPMTIDSAGHGSTKKILVVGHSWVRHLSEAYIARRYPDQEVTFEWGSGWKIADVESRIQTSLTSQHTHLLVFVLLTEAYSKEYFPGWGRGVVEPRKEGDWDPVEVNRRLIHMAEIALAISPTVDIFIEIPPMLDLNAHNLGQLARAPQSVRDHYHSLPRFRPAILHKRAIMRKDRLEDMGRRNQDWRQVRMVRYPMQFVVQSMHRIRVTLTAFMTGRQTSMSESTGPFVDGLHPNEALCQRFWTQLDKIFKRAQDSRRPSEPSVSWELGDQPIEVGALAPFLSAFAPGNDAGEVAGAEALVGLEGGSECAFGIFEDELPPEDLAPVVGPVLGGRPLGEVAMEQGLDKCLRFYQGVLCARDEREYSLNEIRASLRDYLNGPGAPK